jgi:hypothetical protein
VILFPIDDPAFDFLQFFQLFSFSFSTSYSREGIPVKLMVHEFAGETLFDLEAVEEIRESHHEDVIFGRMFFHPVDHLWRPFFVVADFPENIDVVCEPQVIRQDEGLRVVVSVQNFRFELVVEVFFDGIFGKSVRLFPVDKQGSKVEKERRIR